MCFWVHHRQMATALHKNINMLTAHVASLVAFFSAFTVFSSAIHGRTDGTSLQAHYAHR